MIIYIYNLQQISEYNNNGGGIMDVTKEMGIILMELKDNYYNKGMSKITASVRGVRNDKIGGASRRVVIPQLLKSKDSKKFIAEFTGNLKEEFDKLREEDYIKQLIQEPDEENELLIEKDIALIYLFFLSLNDEKKYVNLLTYIFGLLEHKVIKKEVTVINDKNDEVNKLLQINTKYKEEIKELKIISIQRKDKIKEIELKYEIKNEENEKLYNKYQEALNRIQDLEMKILDYEKNKKAKNEKNQDKSKIKKHRIAILGIRNISNDKQYIEFCTVNEKDLINDNNNQEFDNILVYKENIHISIMRKMKKIHKERVKFFDSLEDLNKEITSVEEKYEN